jgi:hypothetical protein
MIEEVKEKLKSSGKITIKPYSDKNVSNMGLEEYNMVVFPGTKQREPMACVEQFGQIRYLNGLDEAAPEIKAIKDHEAKNAKIKEIRSIVAMLEFEKHYNVLDIEDPEFWNKVQTFKPNNSSYWSNIIIECENKEIVLDPANKTEDLLKVLAIEAGGFPLIAKSKEDCISGLHKRKWYLDRQIESTTQKATVAKIKNKALARLSALSEKTPRKLFFIAKLLNVNSIQFKNNTLPDTIYDYLDEYINGNHQENNIRKAAQSFLDYAEFDMQELKIRSIIKDATFHKFIILKGDGLLYSNPDNIMLGRNTSEVYEYLVNPLNEDVLDYLLTRVEDMWSV